jgi:carbonic anhydrase/acetyltransferase-like protein (isoleucine patch superfamily)
MAIYELAGQVPVVAPDAWVADSASVIGRVRLGAQSSVWYGAVLRGDNDDITIGERTSIQDNSVVHIDGGVPLVVGSNVTVGHQVMLHGCTIGDGALIGIGSIILNHARIGRHCLVGAGSLVTEGKEFPDGVMIMGTPAKVVRELTPEQIERLHWSAAHYVELAARHRAGLRRIDR